jgi:hypothetical protein
MGIEIGEDQTSIDQNTTRDSLGGKIPKELPQTFCNRWFRRRGKGWNDATGDDGSNENNASA